MSGAVDEGSVSPSGDSSGSTQLSLGPFVGRLDSISNKSVFRRGFRGHSCHRPVLTIRCSKCGHHHKVLSGSKDRTCAVCQFPLYQSLIDHYYDVLNCYSGRLSLLTLTARPVREQSPDMVRDLGRWLNLLLDRRPHVDGADDHRQYRDIWSGVLAVVECKKTPEGWFYYHLHCIVRGGFVPKSSISSDWLDISGHEIVDISEIRGGVYRALRYVLKYVLKGFSFWGNPKDVDDFRRCMKRVRYVRSYGDFYDSEYHASEHVGFPCPKCASVGAWVLEFGGRVSVFGKYSDSLDYLESGG